MVLLNHCIHARQIPLWLHKCVLFWGISRSQLSPSWLFLLCPSTQVPVDRGLSMQPGYSRKLDGVGPIDNRPSTDKHHHFVRKRKKEKKKWHVTYDTWHVTRDTWHVTCHIWHMTCDTWHMTCDTWWGVNILSKCQLPNSNGLGFMMSWRLGGKESLTDLIN